jgi:hypothetical protein
VLAPSPRAARADDRQAPADEGGGSGEDARAIGDREACAAAAWHAVAVGLGFASASSARCEGENDADGRCPGSMTGMRIGNDFEKS